MRGKVCGITRLPLLLQDHPRLCGEKSAFSSTSLSSWGSPPPMRGKVASIFVPAISSRITPAYAGKSNIVVPSEQPTKDHPRLCGEKSRYSVTLCITAGSPPPMRGKGNERAEISDRDRITPAYAGKSEMRKQSPLNEQDHPRLCGEKLPQPMKMKIL